MSLTPKQQERRERVIAVAKELASEGGYDAVQMRDVANRSDVALGTIYRYFTNKDRLLICVMTDWTSQLRSRLAQRPARGETASAQVADVLARACRALEREPLLASALVRAMSSSEAGVGEANKEVGAHVRAMIEPLLDDLDPETSEGGHRRPQPRLAGDAHQLVERTDRVQPGRRGAPLGGPVAARPRPATPGQGRVVMARRDGPSGSTDENARRSVENLPVMAPLAKLKHVLM